MYISTSQHNHGKWVSPCVLLLHHAWKRMVILYESCDSRIGKHFTRVGVVVRRKDWHLRPIDGHFAGFPNNGVAFYCARICCLRTYSNGLQTKQMGGSGKRGDVHLNDTAASRSLRTSRKTRFPRGCSNGSSTRRGIRPPSRRIPTGKLGMKRCQERMALSYWFMRAG